LPVVTRFKFIDKT